MFRPVRFWRVSVSLILIWGGGSPPALAGHSGSIFFLPLQLHSQAGDGLSMVQFLIVKMSIRLSATSGVDHSSSPIVQGASLKPWEKTGLVFSRIKKILTVARKSWFHTLEVTYRIGSPSMHRVPKPGSSNKALSNFCVLISCGASSL